MGPTRAFHVLLVVAIAMLLYVVWPFRTPLFLAVVLAAVLHRLADRLTRAFRGSSVASAAVLTLGVFVLSFAGLGVSFYPYIVPGALTIEAAAAPRSSLLFLLAGALVLIPLILIYTGFAYWIFRGKIDPKNGYH